MTKNELHTVLLEKAKKGNCFNKEVRTILVDFKNSGGLQTEAQHILEDIKKAHQTNAFTCDGADDILDIVTGYCSKEMRVLDLMRLYKGTYEDKRGQESIEIRSDGTNLYFNVRGIDFEGVDFEMLTGRIEKTKFDYEEFEDGSGDLTNFKITVEIPVQLFDSAKKISFIKALIIHVEVGETVEIAGLDSVINSLKLTTNFGDFTFAKKLEWMEDAMLAIQNQLPENINFETCLSCKFSNYSPYGNGMYGHLRCFKKLKKEVALLNQKHDLLDLWTAERVEAEEIFSVQETFDCSEHEFPGKGDCFYKDWRKLIG